MLLMQLRELWATRRRQLVKETYIQFISSISLHVILYLAVYLQGNTNICMPPALQRQPWQEPVRELARRAEQEIGNRTRLLRTANRLLCYTNCWESNFNLFKTTIKAEGQTHNRDGLSAFHCNPTNG